MRQPAKKLLIQQTKLINNIIKEKLCNKKYKSCLLDYLNFSPNLNVLSKNAGLQKKK